MGYENKVEGVLKEYYDTGVLKYEEHYLNDLLTKTAKEFYPTGILKQETPYQNGLKNGEEKIFQIGEQEAKIFVIADELSKNG